MAMLQILGEHGSEKVALRMQHDLLSHGGSLHRCRCTRAYAGNLAGLSTYEYV